jgi:uncharacterized protein YjbI with pentapeptide repeats
LPGAALAGADLAFTNLFAADLSGADLAGADFNSANMMYANLSGADLGGADFRQANLFAADLSHSRLRGSRFSGAHASGIRLKDSDLEGANLFVADISRANLSGACLRNSNFFGSLLSHSNLTGADCRDADLSGADLAGALLVEVDLTGATLSDCKIKGITATGLKLEGAVQNDLVLTAEGEPEIAVDGFEAALEVTSVIKGTAANARDGIPGTRAVLLLGAYPHERKGFLNAVREEVRKAGCTPLLFDLETAGKADFSPMVEALAERTALILVDLGGMASIRGEIAGLASRSQVPLQPLLAGPSSPEMASAPGYPLEGPSVLDLFQTDDAAMMILAIGPKLISHLT